MLPECVQPRVQARGGTVMVWGGFSHDHRLPLQIVDGNLNGVRYRDELLDTVVRPHFQANAGQRPILMDDNVPAHRARIVEQYKATNGITGMEWPALSPDLNPIEHVWDYLQRSLNNYQPPISTLAQLRNVLVQKYAQIPDRYLQGLVRSMPRRCAAVIQTHGGHT